MVNDELLDSVVEGFIDTMYALCYAGESDADTYAALDLTLAPRASEYIRKTCRTFCDVVALHPHPGLELRNVDICYSFGVDLFLSMQGYSRAFAETQAADGIYGDMQSVSYLERLAKAFGSIDPEVGDDGLIHIIQESM